MPIQSIYINYNRAIPLSSESVININHNSFTITCGETIQVHGVFSSETQNIF